MCVAVTGILMCLFILFVRFEMLTAVFTEIQVLWDVKCCDRQVAPNILEGQSALVFRVTQFKALKMKAL